MPDYKMIIVMRKDLNMRKGKMVAQGCHAAVGAILDHPSHKSVKAWLASSFKKICVSVNSEQELLDVASAGQKAGLITKLITDAGHTEFNGVPTITCCAIGPATHEELQPITGSLPLL